MINKTKNVAVIPTSDFYLNNKGFNYEFNGNNIYIALRSRLENDYYKINTIDLYEDYNDVDVVLFERIDYTFLRLFMRKYPLAKRVLFPWEPEVVSKGHSIENLEKLAKYFDYVLTWNDDLIDDKKFFKINYAHHLVAYSSRIPSMSEFLNRKLLVQVSSNKVSNHPFELYSLRKKFNYLAEERLGNDFSYYGSRWSTKSSSFNGIAQDKTKTISQFKFSLCLENMKSVNGYITEKIFDCFTSGVVPIYYGASNITNYIPKECFIDLRDFENTNELFAYLVSMDYKEWKKYLIEAKEFLSSEKTHQFSVDYTVEKIINVIDLNFNRDNYTFYSYVQITFKSIKQIQRKILSHIKRLVINTAKDKLSE